MGLFGGRGSTGSSSTSDLRARGGGGNGNGNGNGLPNVASSASSSHQHGEGHLFVLRKSGSVSGDMDVEMAAAPASPTKAGGARVVEPAKLWGVPLKMTERTLAWFLATGAILTEGVFRSAAFKHSGTVTLCTTVTYCASALLERVRSGDTVRKGSWRDYFVLAFMTSMGMYMTNSALMYLNYTTRIVAKSSKVIPTMLLGTLIQGRSHGYNWSEYGAASMLVVGIVLFTMGDVDSLPTFDPKGIVLITAALCLDSAAGNFEERRFFNIPNPVSHAEVVYHANLIGISFTTALMLVNGELFPVVEHAVTHAHVLPWISLAAVFGYLSVSFILLLIRHYGATNTEVIKSLRKMISIGASMVLYPKPFGWKYAGGLGATAAGLCAMYAIKRRKLLSSGGVMEAAK